MSLVLSEDIDHLILEDLRDHILKHFGDYISQSQIDKVEDIPMKLIDRSHASHAPAAIAAQPQIARFGNPLFLLPKTYTAKNNTNKTVAVDQRATGLVAHSLNAANPAFTPTAMAAKIDSVIRMLPVQSPNTF